MSIWNPATQRKGWRGSLHRERDCTISTTCPIPSSGGGMTSATNLAGTAIQPMMLRQDRTGGIRWATQSLRKAECSATRPATSTSSFLRWET